MISITILQDESEQVVGMKCIGHSGYADAGSDIICAGVSALVVNAINSIEAFTSNTFEIETDEETGLIDFLLNERATHDTTLLLDSMILGLQGIQNDYGNEYIILEFKEV
ncbi:MAG: ribosomal-processing cysteine protease Prp [Lachnospiraceae bacterium]|nr:ribosomal-processing cysteine protease Prp [Lachnospiraceae bacterium]MDD6505151.1 ribosomal-processing cysteine protease Prp [Lachnospiraceae bacterium]